MGAAQLHRDAALLAESCSVWVLGPTGRTLHKAYLPLLEAEADFTTKRLNGKGFAWK
jgi:hypothetical protein